MRQLPLALFLLVAAATASLTGETISQHEPTLFDPYREPARPLSQASQWTSRVQTPANPGLLNSTTPGQRPQSPATLKHPQGQSPSQQRVGTPQPNPIHHGAVGLRSQWTGNRQYQQRLNAVQNDARFYQQENNQTGSSKKKLDFKIRGLIMTSSNAAVQSLAQNSSGQMMTTEDTDLDTAGGFEAILRKTLPDQTRGEVVYWGLFTAGEQATLEDASGSIETTLDISGLSYGNAGDPLVSQISAGQAILQRDYQYHNLEMNWGGTATGEQVRLEYLAGIRYFKASEDLNLQIGDFALAGQDDNHLLGIQVGALLNWQPKQQLQVHAGVKFGIFANAIDHQLRLQGSEGFAYAGSGASANDLNQSLNKTAAATLGQLDLGFTYQWTDRFQVTSGYRIVGITGLSLTSNQLSQGLAALASNPSVHTSGSMLLHGAYVGLAYDF